MCEATWNKKRRPLGDGTTVAGGYGGREGASNGDGWGQRVRTDEGGSGERDSPELRPCGLSTRRHRRAGTSTADVFSKQSDGTTVAAQYGKLGVSLKPGHMDRINGWA